MDGWESELQWPRSSFPFFFVLNTTKDQPKKIIYIYSCFYFIFFTLIFFPFCIIIYYVSFRFFISNTSLWGIKPNKALLLFSFLPYVLKHILKVFLFLIFFFLYKVGNLLAIWRSRRNIKNRLFLFP